METSALGDRIGVTLLVSVPLNVTIFRQNLCLQSRFMGLPLTVLQL